MTVGGGAGEGWGTVPALVEAPLSITSGRLRAADRLEVTIAARGQSRPCGAMGPAGGLGIGGGLIPNRSIDGGVLIPQGTMWKDSGEFS